MFWSDIQPSELVKAVVIEFYTVVTGYSYERYSFYPSGSFKLVLNEQIAASFESIILIFIQNNIFDRRRRNTLLFDRFFVNSFVFQNRRDICTRFS